MIKEKNYLQEGEMELSIIVEEVPEIYENGKKLHGAIFHIVFETLNPGRTNAGGTLASLIVFDKKEDILSTATVEVRCVLENILKNLPCMHSEASETKFLN